MVGLIIESQESWEGKDELALAKMLRGILKCNRVQEAQVKIGDTFQRIRLEKIEERIAALTEAAGA